MIPWRDRLRGYTPVTLRDGVHTYRILSPWPGVIWYGLKNPKCLWHSIRHVRWGSEWPRAAHYGVTGGCAPSAREWRRMHARLGSRK